MTVIIKKHEFKLDYEFELLPDTLEVGCYNFELIMTKRTQHKKNTT